MGPIDATTPMRSDDFDRARQETIRYHEEFYATSSVGQAGTWLAQPHPMLFDALRRLPQGSAITAYDLGAGIGRHTLPMLRRLPTGSDVYAVDLLQSALDRISKASTSGNGCVLHTVQADLAEFAFPAPADLVIVFSAIEHLPGKEPIRVLLKRIREAIKPGAVVAVGIVADRFEVGSDGRRRPALLESGLSVVETHELLAEVFRGLEIDYLRTDRSQVEERRDGERYTLHSKLVTFLARQPIQVDPRGT